MTVNELRTKRATLWNTMEGFLDTHRNDKGILSADDESPYAFSSRAVAQALFNKLVEKTRVEPASAPVSEQEPPTPEGRSVDELKARLAAIKKYM